MEAKELMDGDWVNFNLYPFVAPYTPCKVSLDMIYRAAKGADVLRFEPIPLTPEILEKNGFVEEELDDSMCYTAMDDCVNVYWRDSEDTMTCAGTETTIPELWEIEIVFDGNDFKKSSNHSFFVHEFQHVLRLCGL